MKELKTSFMQNFEVVAAEIQNDGPVSTTESVIQGDKKMSYEYNKSSIWWHEGYIQEKKEAHAKAFTVLTTFNKFERIFKHSVTARGRQKSTGTTAL